MQAYPQAPPATALDSAFASLTLAGASSSSTTARADSHPTATHRQPRTPTAVSVTPWMHLLRRTDQDRARPPIDLLDEEVAAFVASVRPTKGEQRLRLAALTCLTKVVATLWPTATVELFGSMATGLYLPHGDFDLVISDPSLVTCPTELLLHTLRNALLASHLASTVRLVSHAKVPLVKLVTAPSFGSFAIDVSFNADKGPKGARESLRLLQELETRREGDKMRAKALVFVLKAFLDAHGLNEVRYGGLGGLGIFCLAVSFIQLDPRPPGETSPGRDLLSFLYHYGWTFNYRDDCIVTAGGGRLVRKTEFGFGEQQGHEERLAVQHPVDLARDLTSGTFEIGAVRDALRTAYLSLSSSLTPSSTDALDPAQSLLGRAGLTLKPEVLARREANRALLGPGPDGLEARARAWDPRIEGVKAAWARERGGGGAGAGAQRGGRAAFGAQALPPGDVYAQARRVQAGLAPPYSGGGNGAAASSAATAGLSRFGRAQYAAPGDGVVPQAASEAAYQYHYGGIPAVSSSSSSASGHSSSTTGPLSNGATAAAAAAPVPHYPASVVGRDYFGNVQPSASPRSPPSSHASPTTSFPTRTAAAPAPAPAPAPSWFAYYADYAAWAHEMSTSPAPHRPAPVPPLAPTPEAQRRNPLIPRRGKARKLQYTAL
ncbi:hypothetical protein JCM3775_002866 [Rhodotorula graminis]